MKGESCATCYCLNDCSINKFVRERCIAFLKPESFGCFFHETKEEWEATEAKMKEKNKSVPA